jgi:hypothetical protein
MSRAGPLGERRKQRVLMALAALGWMLAVVLFAVVGWVMNLYVRYALFALPIVVLGTGYLLALVGRRSRPGTMVVGLTLAFFAVEAVALWGYRITYAFK